MVTLVPLFQLLVVGKSYIWSFMRYLIYEASYEHMAVRTLG